MNTQEMDERYDILLEFKNEEARKRFIDWLEINEKMIPLEKDELYIYTNSNDNT